MDIPILRASMVPRMSHQTQIYNGWKLAKRIVSGNPTLMVKMKRLVNVTSLATKGGLKLVHKVSLRSTPHSTITRNANPGDSVTKLVEIVLRIRGT